MGAIVASPPMSLMITHSVWYMCTTTVPKINVPQLKLFPREYIKDRIHVDPKLLAVVLASHDERTHRDVGGIISFNIFRSQI